MNPPSTRQQALRLYKQLLRAAARMPTPNRREFVASKIKKEYRQCATLTDPETIEFYIKYAHTNLDTILIQAEHLTNLRKDPMYQVDI